MTEAAPDKEIRKYGALWYFGVGLILYVASYPIVQAFVIRQSLNGGLGARNTWAILNIIYWPIDRLLEIVGYRTEVIDLLYWLAKFGL